MIVRIRFSGVPVQVGADAKTQVRIFVNHLTVRRVLVEIRREELFILENLLHQLANLTPSCGTGVGFENPTTLRCELIERKIHGLPSSHELPLTKHRNNRQPMRNCPRENNDVIHETRLLWRGALSASEFTTFVGLPLR